MDLQLMTMELATALATSERAFHIAPAGCGKTELIARAVSCSNGKAQLILTHTHAGVNSLRKRLKKYGLSSRSFSVTTLASFAQQYVRAYPRTSRLRAQDESQPNWEEIYPAASRLFDCRVGRDVLAESFSGIYVDEYQDCTKGQHDLVVQLSSIMPCRILGDPLQGIFEFSGGGAFSWRNDVADKFTQLSAPATPWRWQQTNPTLGAWLLDTVRPALKRGEPIDLRRAPSGVYWRLNTLSEQRDVCMKLLKMGPGESISAMHKYPRDAHRFARNLGGAYSSMDELEGIDLQTWAAKFDSNSGVNLALAIIDFSHECMTAVNAQLGTIRHRLQSNASNLSKGIKKNVDVALQIEEMVRDSSPLTILASLKRIQAIEGCRLFRHELWSDMCRVLSQRAVQREMSLATIARAVRDQRRIVGHSIPQRSVSRILLIKGLEFNHAVVLDASVLRAKELYVAMTRGCHSLTVLSPSPVIQVQAAFSSEAGADAKQR